MALLKTDLLVWFLGNIGFFRCVFGACWAGNFASLAKVPLPALATLGIAAVVLWVLLVLSPSEKSFALGFVRIGYDLGDDCWLAVLFTDTKIFIAFKNDDFLYKNGSNM